MDVITGAVQSDPGAGSSKQVTLVEGNTVSLLKPAHTQFPTQRSYFSQPAPETEVSTSMGFRRNV
ncbi:hypothetical protein PO909_029200 [Leuciscus waleckii]